MGTLTAWPAAASVLCAVPTAGPHAHAWAAAHTAAAVGRARHPRRVHRRWLTELFWIVADVEGPPGYPPRGASESPCSGCVGRRAGVSPLPVAPHGARL